MFVFAHYWGIDEVGVFVIPALLALLALRWAERKAKKAAAEKKGETEPSEEKSDVD
jgi:hypothetical protein